MYSLLLLLCQDVAQHVQFVAQPMQRNLLVVQQIKNWSLNIIPKLPGNGWDGCNCNLFSDSLSCVGPGAVSKWLSV